MQLLLLITKLVNHPSTHTASETRDCCAFIETCTHFSFYSAPGCHSITASHVQKTIMHLVTPHSCHHPFFAHQKTIMHLVTPHSCHHSFFTHQKTIMHLVIPHSCHHPSSPIRRPSHLVTPHSCHHPFFAHQKTILFSHPTFMPSSILRPSEDHPIKSPHIHAIIHSSHIRRPSCI